MFLRVVVEALSLEVLIDLDEFKALLKVGDREIKATGIRTVRDLLQVLKSPHMVDEELLNKPAYFMFRNLAVDKDHLQVFERESIRYDITVMMPLTLGDEYNKTFGHYHPLAEPGLTYPEVYQVLYGHAHYILQRKRGHFKVDDVVIVHASRGEVAVIPPNYGHVTVNPSTREPLVMANLVSSAFSSEYSEYRRLRGAAYYELSDGTIVPNPNYEALPPVRLVPATSWSPPNIYNAFIESPSSFEFLNKPHMYHWAKPWVKP